MTISLLHNILVTPTTAALLPWDCCHSVTQLVENFPLRLEAPIIQPAVATAVPAAVAAPATVPAFPPQAPSMGSQSVAGCWAP
jgi:hypothetical protein